MQTNFNYLPILMLVTFIFFAFVINQLLTSKEVLMVKKNELKHLEQELLKEKLITEKLKAVPFEIKRQKSNTQIKFQKIKTELLSINFSLFEIFR